MTNKTQLRSNVPKAIKIIQYWQSTEGIERLRSIEAAFDGEDCSRLVEKMFSNVDADCPACMSCGRTRDKWNSLERCHILGVTHAYESSTSIAEVSAPKNFVLMCRPCHVDSPTTADEMTFWQWMKDTPTRTEQLADCIRTMIHSYGVEVATKAFEVFLHSDPQVVEGRLSTNTLAAGIKAHARVIIKNQSAPYGKKWEDGVLVDNPEEMEVLALIRELRCTGLSFSDLAAELKERGVINREGRAVWSLSTLKVISDEEPSH